MININENVINLASASHSIKLILKINTSIYDAKVVSVSLNLVQKYAFDPEKILQSFSIRLLPEDLTCLISTLEAARNVLKLNYNIKGE